MSVKTFLDTNLIVYANDDREGSRHMRLNFSHCEPEQIREGIRRLSVAVKMQLRGSRQPSALRDQDWMVD